MREDPGSGGATVGSAGVVDQGTWPFVGRDDAVAELARWLAGSDRGLVLVEGDAGVGKTRLVAAAAERARADGRTVVHVRGGAAVATVPFGAFAPVLADLAIDERDDLGVLVALRSAVSDGVVLVVDDLPLLDAGSTAAVVQAVEVAPVIATARIGHPLDPTVAAALDDRGRRLRTEVLSAGDVEAVLHAVLDGPVDAGAVDRLTRTSGGNPLFLRELVLAALGSGGLARDERGWHLGRLDISPRLGDLVAAHLEGLGPDRRDAAELLAAVQPLPLGAIDDTLVEALERSGLVESDRDGIRLAHPLYDEVLRASCPPSRWRRHLATGADLLVERGADEHPDGVLRIVRLRTDAGVEVDPAVLATAARRAHELLDHELAIDLATAALARGGERFDARWVRGAAASSIRRNEDAETDLRMAVALAGDDEQLARALQRLGLQLAARSGRTADALDAVRAEVDRIVDPAWRSFVEADVAKWELSLGRAPSLDAGRSDPAARLNTCAVVALASALDGRFGDAEAAIREGLPLAREHRDVLAYGEELLLVARYLCLVFSGDVDAGRELARRQLVQDTPRRADAVGTWEHLLAQLDLAAGRPGDALVHAAVACERLRWRDIVGLLATAHAVRAAAYAQTGRLIEAEAELAAVDDAARAEVRTGLAVRHAEAWLLAAAGRPADAAAVLAAAGRTGLATAHVVLGAVVAHDAIRLGHPELVAADLADAADGRDGALLVALAEYAAAAVEADGPRLDAVSVVLESVGLVASAADAAGRAAGAHRRRGRTEAARRADRRADGLRATLGLVEAPVLTAREQEVALAAAGERLRSREIGERLGVSTRTVDNHLSRIYRKLGVADRVELAAALRDLGLLTA